MAFLCKCVEGNLRLVLLEGHRKFLLLLFLTPASNKAKRKRKTQKNLQLPKSQPKLQIPSSTVVNRDFRSCRHESQEEKQSVWQGLDHSVTISSPCPESPDFFFSLVENPESCHRTPSEEQPKEPS